MKYAIGGLTRFDSNPAAFMIIEYSETQKRILLDYMTSFDYDSAAGYIDDCRTGEKILQTNVGYTDGEFRWTSQDIYHIRKYNAAVSDEFLNHVMKKRA